MQHALASFIFPPETQRTLNLNSYVCLLQAELDLTRYEVWMLLRAFPGTLGLDVEGQMEPAVRFLRVRPFFHSREVQDTCENLAYCSGRVLYSQSSRTPRSHIGVKR
jgi:hypothetical protein